jgi:endogenous inhibitor of DNA gyrase (YacG/DUF329 family)
MTLKTNCPTCSKVLEFNSQNPSRPFCSERCKLIDFGAWANEAYAIAADEPPTEVLAELESTL